MIRPVSKNIAIQSSELQRAFEEGISPTRSAVAASRGRPVIPTCFWSPIRYAVCPALASEAQDAGRTVLRYCLPGRRARMTLTRAPWLRQAARRAAEMGHSVQVGAECEFYLFETDEYDCPTMIRTTAGRLLRHRTARPRRKHPARICLTLESPRYAPGKLPS